MGKIKRQFLSLLKNAKGALFNERTWLISIKQRVHGVSQLLSLHKTKSRSEVR